MKILEETSKIIHDCKSNELCMKQQELVSQQEKF